MHFAYGRGMPLQAPGVHVVHVGGAATGAPQLNEVVAAVQGDGHAAAVGGRVGGAGRSRRTARGDVGGLGKGVHAGTRDWRRGPGNGRVGLPARKNKVASRPEQGPTLKKQGRTLLVQSPTLFSRGGGAGQPPARLWLEQAGWERPFQLTGGRQAAARKPAHWAAAGFSV